MRAGNQDASISVQDSGSVRHGARAASGRSLRVRARVELRYLAVCACEPALWLLLLALVLLGAAAYRVPLAYTLDIGGAPGGAVFDQPYLQNFNRSPEYDDPAAPRRAFRWAFPDARIVLPGSGLGSYAVTLDVAAGQPGTERVGVEVRGADVHVSTLPLAPSPRSYHLLVPAPAGDLDLRFAARSFQSPGDPRALLFAVDALRMRAATPLLPAPAALAWLAAVVAGGYALLRRWDLPARVAGTTGAVGVLLLVALLAWRRFGLTGFAPRLATILVLAYAGTVVVEPLLRSLARLLRLATVAGETRAVVALAMLACAIRLAGLWHPQALTSDLGLHANNLRNLASGEVIFTEGLPEEAGGGRAPYPPAQYVMLLPGALLLSPERLVQAGNALLDSLVIASNWLLLRSAGASARAGLFAGALYLFALPLLLSLSVGEMANVWAQALVAPLFLALLLRRLGRAPSWLLVGMLALSFLAHSGVFLSLLLFFGVYLVLLWTVDRFPRLGKTFRPLPFERRSWRTVDAAALLAPMLVALGIAMLVYYSAFIGAELGGAGRAGALGIAGLWSALAQALHWRGPIGPAIAALGAVGIGLSLRSRPELGLVLLACSMSALLSLVSLLVSQQTLRWQAFVFPALAVGSGMALARLESRGRAGRIAAYLLVAGTLVFGAAHWYAHVGIYLH